MARRTPKDSLADDIINALKQMTGERLKGIDNRYPWNSDGEVPLFKARMKYPEPPHFTPEEMRRATGFYDRPGNVSPDEHYAQMQAPPGYEAPLVGPRPGGGESYSPSFSFEDFPEQVIPVGDRTNAEMYPVPRLSAEDTAHMDLARLIEESLMDQEPARHGDSVRFSSTKRKKK